MTERLTRRRLLSGAVAASAGIVLASGWPTRSVRAAADADGWIAVTRGRDLLLLGPDGTDVRTVVTAGVGEFVFDVTVSPDGTRLIYGYFTPQSGSGGGGANLMSLTVSPTLGTPTVLVSRDAPGVLLGAPSWAPDGDSVVFEMLGAVVGGAPTIRCDRVNADGTGRQPLVDGGRYPAISPDGRTLTYVKSLPLGDTLWLRPLEGGPEREIVRDVDMAAISYPRFSPDGSVIAFSGVNLSASAPPRVVPDVLRVGLAGPSVRSPLAHGLPTDPWLVRTDGSALRRFVQLSGDDMAVAWSPDGRWLAISGAGGLLVFSVADGSSRVLSEESTYGGMDWR